MRKFKSPRDATANEKETGASRAAAGSTDTGPKDPAKGNAMPTAREAAVNEGVTASGHTMPTAPTNAKDARKPPNKSPIITMILLASMLSIFLCATLEIV
jgi:hypothetical protein